jgi:hypothetical protein
MNRMKKALLAVLIVSGGSTLLTTSCSSGGGQGEQLTETDFETKIATSIAFDPSLLKSGDRVSYLVKRTGENSQRYSWSAVSEDRAGLWIENNMPFQVSRMVVKTKLDRSGKILEQWVGEPGGVPGQTFPTLKGGQAQPKPVRDSASASADSKEEPDRIVVSGQPYDCTRVTTVLTYPDKRKSTMINWFSKDVPFAASRPLGGLVKRQFGRLTMELIKVDRDARPELLIPPK